MKPLSSSLTFFYKFLFPVLWLAFCMIGYLQASSPGPVTTSQWAMLAVGIGGTLCIIFITGRIKQVALDGEVLHISNFFTTIEVPTREIKAISGTSLLSPTLIWFELKQPGTMGGKITFMPRTRMKPGIGMHPMINELKKEFGLQ